MEPVFMVWKSEKELTESREKGRTIQEAKSGGRL